MRISTPSILVAIVFSILTDAVHIVEELTIGNSGKIHSKNGAIENFHLIGLPHLPEILSDKIILTPPAPGNSRGAIWSDKTLVSTYWNIDVDFRATGPERAGGNIQIWYVKNGKQIVGTSSIYTVGKFDGLALTIDQYDGSGGSIRGFFNDGTNDYKSHHKVDNLAFGRCNYSYRNLGRPSRVTISQIDSGLHVDVDGKECFASDKIKLPKDYSIGITAAGAKLPDAVEIFKLVTTIDTIPSGKTSHQQKTNQHVDSTEHKEPDSDTVAQEKSTHTPQYFADEAGDVNKILQSVMKEINKLQQALSTSQSQYNSKQDEITNKLHTIEVKVNSIDSAIEHTLELKRDVVYLKENLHKAIEQHVVKLQKDVRETQETIINAHLSLHDLLSGMGSFTTYILFILGFQAILIAAYSLYRRRKKASAKKYL